MNLNNTEKMSVSMNSLLVILSCNRFPNSLLIINRSFHFFLFCVLILNYSYFHHTLLNYLLLLIFIFLHLRSELLVQQSIHKRVNSSIEHDHRVSDCHQGGTSRRKGVDNLIRAPADSKYDTESHHHQGDTLS